MGYIAKVGHRRGLDTFLAELLDSDCLAGEAARLARAALDRGFDGLGAAEQATLEAQAIDPWCGDCETCGTTPAWGEMLHVYDTGLCSGCFATLLREAPDTLGPHYRDARPRLDDDDDLPEEPGSPESTPGIAATA